jgi:hypothetical protein
MLYMGGDLWDGKLKQNNKAYESIQKGRKSLSAKNSLIESIRKSYKAV